MASQDEDNKLECISNINKDQERDFLNVYKKNDAILNNKNESLENKIESLIDVWKCIGELNLEQFDIRHVIQIMDWAKLHALNIVLTAEWDKHKAAHQENLLQEIEKAQNELLKLSDTFATRCKKLADVVRNPWEDPVLMKLMNTKDADIEADAIEFFCVETAYLVSVRLKKLCESHCEDLALNLVTAFMNCHKMSKIQNFSLNATDTQLWFIFDMHIALLYKFQDKTKIVALLKELTFEDGLQLVKRFAKKRVKISKIWKNCNRVAILASQLYISQAVVKFTDELKDTLESYIEMYISLCNEESLKHDFPESIRRISNLADAAGLYIFCDVIQRKAGTVLKPLVIEMYIRALTTDMNELERMKDANEQAKVELITARLADAFVNLAEFLDEHVKVARECVLTAFSLAPTKERLTKIEDLARRSGFQVLDTGQEWKCKLHPPVLDTDDVAWICTECGDWMCKPQVNAPIQINMALNEALQNSVLGISENLCDDLVVCLSNPRYQVLSWLLPWPDLQRLCIMYLQDPQATKNIVTELKFVDIDYNIFKGIKREPVDEMAGIEKGYEQYLDHDFVSDDESGDEDSTSQTHSIASDGISDFPFFPLLPPPKSDPNTLKSLRMFRPNLKRTKDKDSVEGNAEKIFKTDPYQGANCYESPNPANIQSASVSNGTVLAETQSASISNADSKNVESATLPLLGGQVAEDESILTQVTQKLRSQLGEKLEAVLQISKSRPLQEVYNYLDQMSIGGGISERTNLMFKLLVKLLAKHEVVEDQATQQKSIPESDQHQGLKEIQASIAQAIPLQTTPQQTSMGETLDISLTEKSQPQAEELLPLVLIDQSKTTVSKSNQQALETPSPTNQSLKHPSAKIPLNRPPAQQKQSKSRPRKKQSEQMSLKNPELKQSRSNSSNLHKAPKPCLSSDKRQLLIRCLKSIDPSKTKPSPSREPRMSDHSKTKQSLSPSRDSKMSDPSKAKQSLSPVQDIEMKDHSKSNQSQLPSQGPKMNDCSKSKQSPSLSREPKMKDRSKSVKSLSPCKVPPSKKSLGTEANSARIQSTASKAPAGASQTLRSGQDKVAEVTTDSRLTQEELIIPLTRIYGAQHQTGFNRTLQECTSQEMVNTPGTISSKPPVPQEVCKMTQPKIKTQESASQTVGQTPPMSQTVTNKDSMPCQMSSCTSSKITNLNNSKNISHKLISKMCNNKRTGGHEVQEEGDVSKKFKSDKCNKEKGVGLCDVNDIPKNLNSTDKTNNCTKQKVMKDCVKTPDGGNKLNICKNVNNSRTSTKIEHSNPASELDSRTEIPDCFVAPGKQKIVLQDKGRVTHKNSKRRKSTDQSENDLTIKAPHVVQNHKLSPLQDVNLRMNALAKQICCDLESSKVSSASGDRADKKDLAKAVLSNVPGLNDYKMLLPRRVHPVVNVVHVSGAKTPTVPIPNTQTSTQVTPHIQRIGQPRTAEPKPIETTIATSTSTQTTSTTTTKTASSPLINILSQQIIRPANTTTSTVTTQRKPCINILSQQIIRPPTVKVSASATSSGTSNCTNINSITSTANKPARETTNVVKAVTTAEPTAVTHVNNFRKTTVIPNTTTATTTGQGTILSFICKSSLPKFQQAFGKAVYQTTETTTQTTSCVETTTTATADSKKTTVTKTVPVNVQPIQGSVIYSRQVPVGPTISLIPPGSTTRQVFRIATSNPEQLNLVKDSVIQGKMSALLAAALQGRPKTADGEVQLNCEEGTKVTLTRPTLVQNARIVKPVQVQLPTNAVRAPQANMSSTTLEQLREFDMVYKQIKERSSTTTPADNTNTDQPQEVAPQRISVTYVNQLQKYTQLSPVVVVSSYNNLQPVASPALSVTSQGSSSPCVTPASTPTLPKVATKSSKGKSLKNSPNNISTKSSPIPKPQQKPQEDEHTTQRIFDILAEYAEQLRNSPDLNNKPAPRRRSNPPTNPNHNSKRKKSSSGSKKIGQSGSNSIDMDNDDMTVGSEDSSGGGMVQLSVTDDEQSQAGTSNPVETNENSSSSGSRPLILTDTSVTSQSRNLIIADSSVGEALKMPNTAVIVPGSYIMPVSMVKGGQQIAVVSGGSKILATVPARSGQNMLLLQSFPNQNRKAAISAVKYSTLQPLSGISSQSIAGVSAQPPVILPSNSVATAVALSHPLTLKKIGDERETSEVLLTIAPQKEDQKIKIVSDIAQKPDSSTSVSSIKIKTQEGTSRIETSNEKVFQPYQKSVITNSVGTSVIATTSSTSTKADNNGAPTILNMNIASSEVKDVKSNERIQSVLVTACSSNGPMLSHTTPRYRKVDPERTNNNDIPNKEQFMHNGEKTEQKTIKTGTTYYAKIKKVTPPESQKIDSEMQKQAAIERELRLQKSLSEECEDLGVDEPSTSDLFPEADLLFDSNHSPSYDQSSQEAVKRSQGHEKEDVKGSGINLFSDDDNSDSLRSDLFEYVEYQSVDNALDYQNVQLLNGSRASTESGEQCDNTILHSKCTNMAAVTLTSPVSPEAYESSLNKYKFKYTNKKRSSEKVKQNEISGEVVSSSEDAELSKINCEDGNFKVVHVAITKTDLGKDEPKCELHCHDDSDSPSKRGARRSVRKLCSCCNGSQDSSRKRPHSSRPHTPATTPHKKPFLKKR